MAEERHVEMRDISPRALWLLGLGLGSFVAASAAGLLLFFKPDHAWTFNRAFAPEPRLQIAPAADYAAFWASSDVALSSYGWLDRSHDLATIPIEEAMRLVSEGHRASVEGGRQEPACTGAACPGATPSAKTIP